MEYGVRRRSSLSSAEVLVIAQGLDHQIHLGGLKRWCLRIAAVLVLALPATVVTTLALLFKPAGQLGAESNTGYWLISSILIGVAALSGMGLFYLFGRVLTRRVEDNLLQRVSYDERQSHERLMDRLRSLQDPEHPLPDYNEADYDEPDYRESEILVA